MNERDIARIERATGCSLPSSYSQLLLEFPQPLNALLKLGPADSRALFSDAATIVRWNKFFRAPNYEYENAYGEVCRFPNHHIVIGANCGGDFYQLNAKGKRTAVLLWCHEDGEFTKCAKSLDEFIRQIFASAADLALDGLTLA